MGTNITQNPGGQAGDSLVASTSMKLHGSYTPSERQAQFIARRFSLPLSTAQHVAFLVFGGPTDGGPR